MFVHTFMCRLDSSCSAVSRQARQFDRFHSAASQSLSCPRLSLPHFAVDVELKAELSAVGIPEPLIAWLSINAPTSSKLAFYDDKPEIQALIVNSVPETRGNRTARAAMVEIWRKHLAFNEMRL